MEGSGVVLTLVRMREESCPERVKVKLGRKNRVEVDHKNRPSLDQLGEREGRHGSGFQRQKITSSVAGDRDGTVANNIISSVLCSSRLLRRTAALNALSLNTGST